MTDGREVSVVVETDAGRLWSMVTDVTRMGEWSPETERAEWIDGATGPAVGARFKGHNRKGRTRWSTTCEVIESEPGRVFAFAVGKVAKPETVWRYRFEPLADGVRVTESFELTKPLGLGSRLVTRVTTGVTDRPADRKEGMRTTLAALKRSAEGAATPPTSLSPSCSKSPSSPPTPSSSRHQVSLPDRVLR